MNINLRSVIQRDANNFNIRIVISPDITIFKRQARHLVAHIGRFPSIDNLLSKFFASKVIQQPRIVEGSDRVNITSIKEKNIVVFTGSPCLIENFCQIGKPVLEEKLKTVIRHPIKKK